MLCCPFFCRGSTPQQNALCVRDFAFFMHLQHTDFFWFKGIGLASAQMRIQKSREGERERRSSCSLRLDSRLNPAHTDYSQESNLVDILPTPSLREAIVVAAVVRPHNATHSFALFSPLLSLRFSDRVSSRASSGAFKSASCSRRTIASDRL